MGAFGELFGFSKSKRQGDYGGVKPMESITESALYKPTFKGQGGVFDAIKRQNTGYDPRVMSDQESTWANLARRAYGEGEAKIGGLASPGGLGRSSLRAAQGDYMNKGLAMDLANKAAAMRLANEANISQQQMQGRGLGVQGVGMDAQAKANRAAFEKAEFNRQQAYRERADEAQKAGILRSLTLGASALGGLGGGALGAAGMLGEGVTGLEGALSGMQMGGGLFSDPVTGAANAAKTLGIGGYAPTPLIGGGLSEQITGDTDTSSATVNIEGFGNVNQQDLIDTINAILKGEK